MFGVRNVGGKGGKGHGGCTSCGGKGGCDDCGGGQDAIYYDVPAEVENGQTVPTPEIEASHPAGPRSPAGGNRFSLRSSRLAR